MSLTYLFFLVLLSILLFTQTTSSKNSSYWEGTVLADVDNVMPEKAFSYIADFCNVYKIYPITVSFCKEGDPQNIRTGHRRFTASLLNGTNVIVQWEEHRLEKLDKVKMTLTYKTLSDNIFIDYYHATLTMFPATEGKKGSLLMWHYILSPVGGFTNETAHFSIQDLAQVVARNIVKISN